jgi:hypothetical protein
MFYMWDHVLLHTPSDSGAELDVTAPAKAYSSPYVHSPWYVLNAVYLRQPLRALWRLPGRLQHQHSGQLDQFRCDWHRHREGHYQSWLDPHMVQRSHGACRLCNLHSSVAECADKPGGSTGTAPW